MGRQRDTDRPWRLLACDFIGPLPLSKRGHRWLFVVVDNFLKYVILHPMKNATAPKVIEFTRDTIFLKHGVPETIMLDNGSQFRSNLFQDFAKSFNVNLWYNAIYHPQANPTEAANSTLICAIRAYIKDDLSHNDWDCHLAELQCALNTAPHTSTQMSPYFVIHGEELVLSGNTHSQKLESELPVEKPELMAKIREKVILRLDEAYLLRQKRYDTRTREIEYNPGDLVFRRNFRLSNAGQRYTANMADLFLPSIVVAKVGTNCYRLKDMDDKVIKGIYSTMDLRK